MKNHVIIDFETFGTNVGNCAVVNCAVLKFDWERFYSEEPYTFEELVDSVKVFKLNSEEQVKVYDFKISQSTLEWWKSLPKNVHKQIYPSSDDLLLHEFCEVLSEYCANIDIWWTRGNNFDGPIMERLFREVNKKYSYNITNPFKFYTIKDTRTFIDCRTNFELKRNDFFPKGIEGFEHHNSKHDVAMDIMRMQYIERNG